jgi:hypothetical protein
MSNAGLLDGRLNRPKKLIIAKQKDKRLNLQRKALIWGADMISFLAGRDGFACEEKWSARRLFLRRR